MKRRLTKVVGSVVLSGAFLGGAAQSASAQTDLSKEARHEAKREAKMQRDYAKLDRWLERHDSKRSSQLTKQQRFDTPYTARGSEVELLIQGQYVSLGYIDKYNKFRPYR